MKLYLLILLFLQKKSPYKMVPNKHILKYLSASALTFFPIKFKYFFFTIPYYSTKQPGGLATVCSLFLLSLVFKFYFIDFKFQLYFNTFILVLWTNTWRSNLYFHYTFLLFFYFFAFINFCCKFFLWKLFLFNNLLNIS